MAQASVLTDNEIRRVFRIVETTHGGVDVDADGIKQRSVARHPLGIECPRYWRI
jgi:hypothetical protein